MPKKEPTAVLAAIRRGGFSDERIFEVDAVGGKHLGACSIQYCYQLKGQALKESEPEKGTSITGKVVARFVRWTDSNALVLLPDGEVVEVAPDQTSTIRESSPDVSVQS